MFEHAMLAERIHTQSSDSLVGWYSAPTPSAVSSYNVQMERTYNARTTVGRENYGNKTTKREETPRYSSGPACLLLTLIYPSWLMPRRNQVRLLDGCCCLLPPTPIDGAGCPQATISRMPRTVMRCCGHNWIEAW
ncbi:unnamed protein product [Ectocarpus sp. 4 AP-2014]